ncbi:MAG TPA: hypothetical protein VGW38_23230 [Chloroflexota bacterium]|nr:hypothetical protein [Chloroflexota bacterium]
MTATEQLQHQLDAMPPELREAEAARILSELKARMQERQGNGDQLTVAEAVAGLRTLRKRQRLGDDLTIRDLIKDGRRM